MKLAKALFGALAARRANGLMVKLRHAWPHPLALWRAFGRPASAPARVDADQKIVVVGIGIAALTCLNELKNAGFGNVTVIARDDVFGGKCVNFGCMPSEFVGALGDMPHEDQRARLEAFVAALRQDVAEQFAALGYPLRVAEVKEVRGKRVLLGDGAEVSFDRLIVATGSRPLPHPRLPNDLPTRVPIEDFWRVPAGTRVAIVSDGNVAALSLGDIALRLGMRPTVLLCGANPLAPLPAFRHFVREMGRRGVAIHENARVIRADAETMVFEAGGKTTTAQFDAVVIASRPVPRIPPIDGVNLTIYDLDLSHASWPRRPDVVFLGDASGLFLAAEAEVQAKLLVRCWKRGEPLDLRTLGRLPVALHATLPLALIGEEWTLAERDWREIDFRSLGWSKAHAANGKLWYLLDEARGMVEAIHICHPNAAELICLAAALMRYPVWHLNWMAGFIHPSSAEIFKVLAEQATGLLGETRDVSADAAGSAALRRYRLPPVEDLHPNRGLPEWLDEARFRKGVMSRQPRAYFGACYGIWQLARDCGQAGEIRIDERDDGTLALVKPAGASVEFVPGAATVDVVLGNVRAQVSW